MLIILVITFLLAFLTVRQHRKSKRLPPGPFPLPLIGNIPQVLYYAWKKDGIVPMLTMFRETYGDVFTIWLGPFPHVSICDNETAHEVFVKNGLKYVDRVMAPIFHVFRNGLGVAMANGDNWRELRKFSMQTLKNMGAGKDLMEEKILNELNARCADIDKKSVNGVSVQRVNVLFDLTVGSIINSFLVGVRFDETNQENFIKLKTLLDEAMNNLNPIHLLLPVWALEKLFPTSLKLQFQTHEKIKDFAAGEALKRVDDALAGRTTIDDSAPQDLVDSFILKMKSDPNNPAYTKESLRCLLADLWTTGQETTTTTLISAFNQFMNHPEIMDKVREELMKVTGGGSRPLSMKDRNNTPYFVATLNEIQRHASILNLSAWKINYEPTIMGGYPVDAGTFVTAQLSAIHTNEEIFKESHKFDPSRFMKDEKLAEKVIAFGVGKRSCLGEALARTELYLITGNLLLRYNFRPHGTVPPTTDVAPFSLAKRPFKLEIEFVKI